MSAPHSVRLTLGFGENFNLHIECVGEKLCSVRIETEPSDSGIDRLIHSYATRVAPGGQGYVNETADDADRADGINNQCGEIVGLERQNDAAGNRLGLIGQQGNSLRAGRSGINKSYQTGETLANLAPTPNTGEAA